MPDLIVKVETTKPLDEFGSGHVLLYNSREKVYFPMTRNEIFAEQNVKIEELTVKYEELCKRVSSVIKAFETQTNNSIAVFEASVDNKFNDFLKLYKETNAKTIEMVKSLLEVK